MKSKEHEIEPLVADCLFCPCPTSLFHRTEPFGSEQPSGIGSFADRPTAPTAPAAYKMKLLIGATTFHLTLDANDAARTLVARLPFTASMGDLNANEKYYYLPFDLPTRPIAPQTIRAGDLMLFGSNCLVLFYQSFSTSYRYTRLGHLDNPALLASVLGSGTISVTFKLDE